MNSYELTGKIHSIESLGATDGPGLRSVIFLQGCPLRCRYCHNPDSWAADGGQPMSVNEIVRRVLRNRVYFGDNGGVTLSGGDALMQPAFTAALLRELKAAGLHTALDTSGWLPEEAGKWLDEILRFTDLILLDIKSPDPERFKWLTGRETEPLLSFLSACEQHGTTVWIRQVIVPGWNDKPEDIRQLAAFLDRWPALAVARVQLLPYHTMGLVKWEKSGMHNLFSALPPMDRTKLDSLQRLADQCFAHRLPGEAKSVE